MAIKTSAACLLIGCCLMLNPQMFAAIPQSSEAAVQPIKYRVQRLIEEVNAKGRLHTMSLRAVQLLGFPAQAFPEREIDLDVPLGQQSAESFEVGGHSYVLISFNDKSFNSMRGFLLNDDGEVVKGFKGGKVDGLQELPLPDAIVQAGAEKDFWFAWLSNGAKLPAPTPKRR